MPMSFGLVPNQNASKRTKNRVAEHKSFHRMEDIPNSTNVSGFVGRECVPLECAKHCDWRGWIPVDEFDFIIIA